MGASLIRAYWNNRQLKGNPGEKQGGAERTEKSPKARNKIKGPWTEPRKQDFFPLHKKEPPKKKKPGSSTPSPKYLANCTWPEKCYLLSLSEERLNYGHKPFFSIIRNPPLFFLKREERPQCPQIFLSFPY